MWLGRCRSAAAAGYVSVSRICCMSQIVACYFTRSDSRPWIIVYNPWSRDPCIRAELQCIVHESVVQLQFRVVRCGLHDSSVRKLEGAFTIYMSFTLAVPQERGTIISILCGSVYMFSHPFIAIAERTSWATFNAENICPGDRASVRVRVPSTGIVGIQVHLPIVQQTLKAQLNFDEKVC